MQSRIVALLVLVMLLACCGGSGGGGGDGDDGFVFTNALFTGDYKFVLLRGAFGIDYDFTALWGRATGDGAGNLAITGGGANNNGSVSPLLPAGTTYTVEPDGEMEIGGMTPLRGTISPDGRMALVGTFTSGNDPAILVLIRCASGASDADLSGEYHATSILVVPAAPPPAVISGTGRATFDGSGGGVSEPGRVINSEGFVTASPLSPVFTYAVSPDGSTTINGAAFPDLEGGIVPGGGFAILGGSTTDTDPPTGWAFLEASTTASNGTLAGEYGMVGIGYDPFNENFRSFTGRARSDGAGAFTIKGTANEDGTIVEEAPDPVPYVVEADGTLHVFTPGGILRGGVAPDGSLAILGGPIDPGSDPVFYVLARH